MKKRIVSLLMLCLTNLFVACNTVATPTDDILNDETQIENSMLEDKPTDITTITPEQAENKPTSIPTKVLEKSDEKLSVFSKEAILKETVMFDENGVKITATGLNYTKYSVELELTIENNSEKNLSFISGSMGYSCNSVNGYMINDGYLNCDVAAGKKAKATLSFSYDELILHGINEIADIEIGFDISDDDYNHTYSGPRQVKTSAFDLHDYTKNDYQIAITNSIVMNTYDYEMNYFSKDMLYEQNGVQLVSSGIMVKPDGETVLLLELENTTSNMVYITTSNIVLNGLFVNSSTWSSDAVNPGKRGVIQVDISSVLDLEYWGVYGIKEIGSIALTLGQQDEDGNDITDSIPIEIVVPGVKAEYDSSGKEIYNNAGLRIVMKDMLEDSLDYSKDVYVLLLVENHSGKTLKIDDVYDSLSVNGFMTDYSCYSREIQHGESAVFKIELWESSLEDNNIAFLSDINEIEVGFEIKAGRDLFDKPMIQILFE